jgi:hypothetical protein
MTILMLWSGPRSRSTAFFRAYCDQVGIEFRPEALTWQPADRPEWELSRDWHTSVASSSGLGEIPASTAPELDFAQHPELSRYLAHHLPFYQELHDRRLRPKE